MIKKTNDYSIFKKYPGNTPIDSLNLKKIINSLKINNMLEFRPILVTQDMEVIDGQHRLEAAKALGLEVYYTIKEHSRPIDMLLLNNAQRSWKLSDYVNFYASQGIQCYKDILRLSEKFSLSPVEVLRYAGLVGGRDYSKIKNGKLDENVAGKEPIISEITLKINTAIEFIDKKTLGDKKYLGTAAIHRGLLTLLNHGEFDFDLFMQKLHIGIGRIHSCNTIEQYYNMFKAIYNYRNQNQIE